MAPRSPRPREPGATAPPPRSGTRLRSRRKHGERRTWHFLAAESRGSQRLALGSLFRVFLQKSLERLAVALLVGHDRDRQVLRNVVLALGQLGELAVVGDRLLLR